VRTAKRALSYIGVQTCAIRLYESDENRRSNIVVVKTVKCLIHKQAKAQGARQISTAKQSGIIRIDNGHRQNRLRERETTRLSGAAWPRSTMAYISAEPEKKTTHANENDGCNGVVMIRS
jgi:hypothetical protein